MTVEERIERLVDELTAHGESMSTAIGKVAEGMEITEETIRVTKIHLAAKHFKALIEDCAKVTDKESVRLERLAQELDIKAPDAAFRFRASAITCNTLGRGIRALAGPTEERKESEA